ncbi:MAG: dienelactone hydrolase family protein [Pseudorhodoplanes sp.]|uniref:dienelactone hydrolase family protein n=1 Tax=Pseudorhodoplanes sp. TaxID=1934341 RepID=UPI003D0F1B75
MTELVFFNGAERLSSPFFPAESGDGAPAVLLFPAIAGINDYIVRVAQRLAVAGFSTLVLNYYAREGAAPDVSTPERIGAAVEALPDARVLSDARGAIGALRTRPDVDERRIATVGFCIGGTYSFLTGCETDDVAAAVDYYGSIRYAATSANKPVSPLDRAAALRVPLLGHFGTADRLISCDDVSAFENALHAGGRSYEFYLYRGAPHAFDEDFRPVYRPVAAAEAWQRTLTFLKWHCRA